MLVKDLRSILDDPQLHDDSEIYLYAKDGYWEVAAWHTEDWSDVKNHAVMVLDVPNLNDPKIVSLNQVP